MSALLLSDWFTQFDNYRGASGWGSGPQKTQLAYMRPCISAELITAVSFDTLTNVETALENIREYLDQTVKPLTLRRLEVLRYKPPQGQSVTQVVQNVISMFRDARMEDMNTYLNVQF